MTYGCVSPLNTRSSFEDLATKFEGSTSGTERAYKRTVHKLTTHLVDTSVLGIVELKQIKKTKKTAAATYEYKAVQRYANDDDCLGEIRFDFSDGTERIKKPADSDLSQTNIFAKIAIHHIRKIPV